MKWKRGNGRKIDQKSKIIVGYLTTKRSTIFFPMFFLKIKNKNKQ
jgi:hypothetical protein